MRELKGHEVDGIELTVEAQSHPVDGACHEYRVLRVDGAQVGSVTFHRAIAEEGDNQGVNGVTPESLIVILADHLKDKACYSERERGMACKRLDEALRALRVAVEKKAKAKGEKEEDGEESKELQGAVAE